MRTGNNGIEIAHSNTNRNHDFVQHFCSRIESLYLSTFYNDDVTYTIITPVSTELSN